VLAADDFEAKLASPNIQVIDVRTPEEYKAGHINDALNINFYGADFKAQMARLDKSKPLAVYCGVGGRSAKAAAIVSELGFKTIYDLQGGMSAWRSKGKKEVK
jgi:rhodanese-related sulfurtransferase